MCSFVEQPDGPVRGTIDCLIEDTDALISHPPDIMRYIKRGDFVPLATFAPERLAMLPDVSTCVSSAMILPDELACPRW